MSTVIVNPYRYSGGAAFTPDDLFASGENGGWYDASISASMWQETGESTSAGDTDPVGRWKDQSGNNLHLDQATAGLKPTLNTSGGLWYVAFDGSDDSLVSATSAAGSQPFVIALAIDPQIAGSNNSTDITAGSEDATNPSAVGGDTGGVFAYAGGTVNVGANTTGAQVLVYYFDGASSEIWRNGSSLGTGNAGTRGLLQPCLGDHPTYGRAQQSHIYAAVFRDGTLSAGQRGDLESWLADKCGVSL